ncbi:DUF4238 domain-containing protein [Vibrio cholerae]|uniref:DUF4238 domain-containing protein n=1 Tax=Vibrio cholerae TaxID=666 RepID=UPI0011DBDA35|nr:DUF4238 domain-containing protein [Vibrio cholerae]TXZ93643.1 DUF4238 domain-containing protein [Vibrio cholerae]GHX73058.1 hypothetical protein VCSRO16_3608 [Vibrio cholerae]
MFKKSKKRQHYVWRRYLKAWACGNQIACLRNRASVFSSELMGIAQQNYFYKVGKITSDDIEYVKSLLLHDETNTSLEIYDRILKLFSMIELIDRLPDIPEDMELKELKSNYAINLEEEIQSHIEDQGEKCLKSLLEKDTSFFKTKEGAADFLSYICMQYLRTKKQQDSIINGFGNNDKERIINCINLIRIIFSNKLAANLYLNRHEYKVVIAENISMLDFLTCDQPVINFLNIDTPVGKDSVGFGLYYPISPRLAVFFVERSIFGSVENLTFDETTVREFNSMVIASAHEQVYASSKDQLRCFLLTET